MGKEQRTSRSMLLGERIRFAIEQSGLEVTLVASKIGMSTANLYRIFKRDSIDTQHLLNICKVLSHPLHYFLPEDPELLSGGVNSLLNGTNNPSIEETVKELATKLEDSEQKIQAKDKEIKMLKDRLVDKEDIISVLKTTIKLYKERVPLNPWEANNEAGYSGSIASGKEFNFSPPKQKPSPPDKVSED